MPMERRDGSSPPVAQRWDDRVSSHPEVVMVEADKPTVVDAHAVIEGKLKGKDAQILGRFKGEIELSGRLMMGEGSRVDANGIAEQADIAGEFSGDLKVKNLILLEKARVEGALEAQNLAVREGPQLNGSVSSGS